MWGTYFSFILYLSNLKEKLIVYLIKSLFVNRFLCVKNGYCIGIICMFGAQIRYYQSFSPHLIIFSVFKKWTPNIFTFTSVFAYSNKYIQNKYLGRLGGGGGEGQLVQLGVIHSSDILSQELVLVGVGLSLFS